MSNEYSIPPLNKTSTSCWRQRTTLEKILIYSCIFLTILVAIIFLIQLTSMNLENPKVCLSPACVEASAQILHNINKDADPCDDFYNFICGNFLKTTIIPEHLSSVSVFSTVDELITKQINSLLEQPIEQSDPKFFNLVKSYYKSCMDAQNIENLANFKKILKKAGNWPVLKEKSTWDDRNINWESTIYKFMSLGLNSNIFFEIKVERDVKKSSKNVLVLDQPYISLFSMKKGFSDKDVQAYHNYVTKIAIALGANPNRANVEIRDCVNLDVLIANTLVPDEERRDPSLGYNPMTIRQLEEKYINISWLNYFNALLHPVKRLNYEDVIVVAVPKYFEQLPKILMDTPKRTIANYVFWKGIQSIIPFLNGDVLKIREEFLNIVSGTTKKNPRWLECTQSATNILNIASSSMYVKNFFKANSRGNVKEIVKNIKNRFVKTLEQVEWMDDLTKKHALEKAGTMASIVGYPDELVDEAKIDDYYKNLILTSNDYLECNLNVSLFSSKISFLNLDKVVERFDWTNHAFSTSANAFYDPSKNNIQFPAGSLQDPLYNKDKPQYLNYGAIGYLIGHEISHAFDDQGKEYDKNGNLNDWWQPKTQIAFNDKIQCIINQYSNITVPEINLNINGINTQGENVADNGGVKQAYLAYSKWVKKNGNELQLPGLSYTPQQLFWISAGSIWCEKNRMEQLKDNILASFHPPGRYRVNVPLLNSEYFARDFKCPLGSRMNPVEKCTIW